MRQQEQTNLNVNCADCGQTCFGMAYNFGRVQCGTCFFAQCRQEQAGKFPFDGLTLEQARQQQ